jgi:RNAse (barnase) inhibitor barstar
MATFKRERGSSDRLDFRILRDSPVTLYFKQPVLHADIGWFTSQGYHVRNVRSGIAASPEALIGALGQVLAFPEQFARNLDAFGECLANVDVPEPGLVLVLEDFGTFAAAFRRQAQALLDVCASQSRRLLLTGQRFIVLAHSKDPRIQFDAVGATPVMWNPEEGLKSARGL